MKIVGAGSDIQTICIYVHTRIDRLNKTRLDILTEFVSVKHFHGLFVVIVKRAFNHYRDSHFTYIYNESRRNPSNNGAMCYILLDYYT